MAKLTIELNYYTVRGSVAFPPDMLRYNRCWPQNEGDSGVIRSAMEHEKGPFEVKIVGLEPPTIGRWESFGWHVYVGEMRLSRDNEHSVRRQMTRV